MDFAQRQHRDLSLYHFDQHTFYLVHSRNLKTCSKFKLQSLSMAQIKTTRNIYVLWWIYHWLPARGLGNAIEPLRNLPYVLLHGSLKLSIPANAIYPILRYAWTMFSLCLQLIDGHRGALTLVQVVRMSLHCRYGSYIQQAIRHIPTYSKIGTRCVLHAPFSICFLKNCDEESQLQKKTTLMYHEQQYSNAQPDVEYKAH